MADLLQILTLLALLACAAMLLLLLRAARSPSIPLDAAAVGAHVSQQMQPWLLDVGQKLGALQMLPQQGLVRAEEEKHVRESLARLETVTKETPALKTELAVVRAELHRLQGVEQGVRALQERFVGAHGRGEMGEDAVASALQGLDPSAWERQFSIAGKRADFAVRMPNGALCCIDSKTSGVGPVQEFFELGERALAADGEEREKLLRERRKAHTRLRSAVLGKAEEVALYARPQDGTLPFAVQAVPDPLFAALDGPTRQEAAKQGVHIVPYGLLLPFVHLLRAQHGSAALDTAELLRALEAIQRQHDHIRDALQHKFEKARSMLGSGIRDIEQALDEVEQHAAKAQAKVPEGAPLP